MGQGSIDVQRFAGDGFLAIGRQMLQGAHVVQPVGHFDQNHAHIADHRQQHLADVFRLAIFAVGELDFVDLGYAFDNVRDLLAELFGDVFGGYGGVFDGVVQQPGRDGGRVQLHFGQNLGYFERVQDVGLSGGAELPVWCCTQNSHALRMMPMSSLGRFLPIVASNSANFAARMSGSAGGSSGVECTVAIPDYRLLVNRYGQGSLAR